MSQQSLNPTRPRRLAVLFGISKYTDPFPLLPNVKTDINALHDTLKEGLDEEFRYDEVRAYKDEEVTQQRIEAILEDLAKDSPVDELLFYLAGHGCLKRGKGYFVTYGIELVNPGIRLSDLSELLQAVKPKIVLVVLDFCHAGYLINGLEGLKADNININSTEKLAVLAAARSGESAVAGNDNHLSFTQYFITALTTSMADQNGHIRWGQVTINVCSTMERSLYQTPVDHCDYLKAHIINKRPINNNKPSTTNQLSIIQNNEEIIKTYCSKLKEQINKVRIFGENQERELSQIFVELTIVEEFNRPSETLLGVDLLDRLSLEERYPFLKKTDNTNDKSNKQIKTTKKLEELLREGCRALIVGAPGSGKSVLMKYLTLQTLLSDKYIGRLPIFIELKKISQTIFTDLKENFENLLVENIISKAVGLDDSRLLIQIQLKELLKTGKVSIFLDGLDEIKAESFFNRLCESISVFLKATSSSNSLIISSRPYAVGNKLDSIKEMEIAPLNYKQIKDFVNFYYPKESGSLTKQLERKEHKELTRVPLLLSILISLYHKGETVDNRLDLYKLITNHLVTVIDEVKTVDRQFRIADREGTLILDLLKELAFDKLFDSNIQDHTQRFIFTYNEILKKAKSLCSNARDAHLLAADVKSVAIVREIANQTYAFTHLTLQEYLAAVALSEKDNSEQLICQTYFNEILVQLEVLPMAIALNKNPKNIYQRLRNLPESLDYINFRLRVRSFIYLSAIYKDSLLDEVKDISNQLINLIKGDNLPQTPYQQDIFSTLSSCLPFYLNLITVFLISLLSDPNSRVRSKVAYALGSIGSDKATDSLINALSDPDWNVRASAAYALGSIEGEKAIDSLINTLSDPDWNVRTSATYTLGSIGGEKAIDSLANILFRSDNALRSNAIIALGNIGNDKATELLINALSDSDWSVRSNAAYALGGISSDKATDSLINALSDSDSFVRSRVAYALSNIGSDKATDSLINALSDSDSFVRSRVAYALSNIHNSKSTDPLINALSDFDSFAHRSIEERLNTTVIEQTIHSFINALSDPDGSVRYNAAISLKEVKEQLKKQGKDLFSQVLVKAAKSKNISTRKKAVEVAGYYTTEKELVILLNQITNQDPDPKVRELAQLALSCYQNKLKLFSINFND